MEKKAPLTSAERRRGLTNESATPMINAITIKGFWRGNGGNYREVYKLLDKLRADSQFFDVAATEKLGIELPTSLEEGDYAAPFEVTLMLKDAIAAPAQTPVAN